jgi:hypothetical protein
MHVPTRPYLPGFAVPAYSDLTMCIGLFHTGSVLPYHLYFFHTGICMNHSQLDSIKLCTLVYFFIISFMWVVLECRMLPVFVWQYSYKTRRRCNFLLNPSYFKNVNQCYKTTCCRYVSGSNPNRNARLSL